MSAKTFRDHTGAIRSVCFDPEGDLLCSASSDGTVKIWNIAETSCVKSLGILPNRADGLFQLDWHPNGKLIAIPVKNQVHVYERDSWDKLYAFAGDEGHSKDVSMAVWSPNGEFIASVSVTGEIIVWSTNDRVSLGRFKHKDGLGITSVAWHPKGNEIAWADAQGKFSIWKEPVPEASQFAAPTGGDAVAQAEVEAQSLANLFPDEDDEEVGTKRKRLRKAKAKKVTDDSDDEDNGIESSITKDMPEPNVDNESEVDYGGGKAVHQESQLQAPFQPSSTPVDGSRRILVWNNVGVITSREGETENSIDVEFHDVQRHKPWRMKDNHGFTMGTLSEQCILMATPNRTQLAEDERAGAELSTLFCKILDHWATDETWHLTFPANEEVEGIAAGEGDTGFVACTTSKNVVRIFSITGVPKHVMCLDGPSIAIAAKESQFFVTYNQAEIPGSSCFGFMLFDVDERKMLHKDRLPVSNNAEIGWVGFTDEGMPAVADTDEVVRVLVNEWGYTWTPIIELKVGAKSEHDNHWVIGIADNELNCIVCKGGATYPICLPRPIPSNRTLQIPIVSSLQSGAHEESFLRSKMLHEHVVRVEGLDFSDAEDRSLIIQQQRRMDMHIIRCIDQAIKNNRPGRALDLATYLTAVKSIDGSIKLAAHRKMQLLAERMMLVKQGLVQQQNENIRVMRASNAFMTPPMTSQRAPMRKQAWNDTPEDRQVSKQNKTSIESYSPAASAQKKAPARKPFEESDEGSESDSEVSPTPLNQRAQAKPTIAKRKSPVKALTKPKNANPFAKGSAGTNPFAAKSKEVSSTPMSELGRADAPAADASPKKRATPTFLQQASLSSQPAKKRKTEKDPNAPKKPLGSYMLWLGANRKKLKTDNPGIKNKDILVKAGEAWKALGEEDKAEWNSKAAEAKEDYKQRLAAYENGGETPAAAKPKEAHPVEEDAEEECAPAVAEEPRDVMEQDEDQEVAGVKPKKANPFAKKLASAEE